MIPTGALAGRSMRSFLEMFCLDLGSGPLVVYKKYAKIPPIQQICGNLTVNCM